MKWAVNCWLAVVGALESLALILLLKSVSVPFEKIVIALLALIWVSLSSNSRGTLTLLTFIVGKVDSNEAAESAETIEKVRASGWVLNITDWILYIIALGQLLLIVLNK